MRLPLLKHRAKRLRHTEPATDDRDLIAFVNEARNDAQRERAIRAARARTLAGVRE